MHRFRTLVLLVVAAWCVAMGYAAVAPLPYTPPPDYTGIRLPAGIPWHDWKGGMLQAKVHVKPVIVLVTKPYCEQSRSLMNSLIASKAFLEMTRGFIMVAEGHKHDPQLSPADQRLFNPDKANTYVPRVVFLSPELTLLPVHGKLHTHPYYYTNADDVVEAMANARRKSTNMKWKQEAKVDVAERKVAKLSKALEKEREHVAKAREELALTHASKQDDDELRRAREELLKAQNEVFLAREEADNARKDASAEIMRAVGTIHGMGQRESIPFIGPVPIVFTMFGVAFDQVDVYLPLLTAFLLWCGVHYVHRMQRGNIDVYDGCVSEPAAAAPAAASTPADAPNPSASNDKTSAKNRRASTTKK